MPQPVGRPRWEQRRIDKALQEAGGLRALLLKWDREQLPSTHIAALIEERTGIRIHPCTVRKWVREYIAA